MNKEEIFSIVDERLKAHGNWLNWLRNINKDKKNITKYKEMFVSLYNLAKEDNSLIHPVWFDHFQYYCKKWYKLPYINKVD